jgi:ribosomal protein S7
MKEPFEIKKKIINHFMKNGKKSISEKMLLNSLKELQKTSLKQSEELIKNAIVNSIPIFTIHQIKKKKKKIKEIPVFINNNKSRVSLAIKLIINAVERQTYFFKDFNKEILNNNQQKGNSIQLKSELQKKVIENKRYFRFYRWS